MTGIIFKGIERGDFSLLQFYKARAKRIVPALAVLCLFLLSFGWFFLTPLDYEALGKHASSSMGFISNFTYWKEVGYFDSESSEKWLLHTWSLSAEWQFYIIYPISLLLMSKILQFDFLKNLILAMTILGFAFCVYATEKWPNSAYYLLHTRAWEMLLGGVAYLYPISLSGVRKRLVELLGLCLVLISILFITEDMKWPGYFSIIPVFGAFLILQSQLTNSVITGNIFLQKIGLWSYSIYLWHWPIVVAFYYFSIDDFFIIPGVVLSIVLGFLSFNYIEKNNFSYKTSSLFILSIIASVFISETDGENYNSNLSKYFNDLKYPRYCHVDGKNESRQDEFINCKVGNIEKESIGLIWGDSYAGILDPFTETVLQNKYSFISRTTSFCFPSLSLDSMLGGNPEYCKRIRNKNIEEVSSKQYDVIFLAGRWDSMYKEYGVQGLNSLIDSIAFSSKNAKQVFVFEQPIFYKKNVTNQFLRNKASNMFTDVFLKDDLYVSQVNRKVIDAINNKSFDNVNIVTRDIIYGSVSHNEITPDGLPYTFDRGHLSLIGSITAANNFMKDDLYLKLKEVIEDQ